MIPLLFVALLLTGCSHSATDYKRVFHPHFESEWDGQVLATRPLSFRPDLAEEIEQLRDFIRKHYPDAHMVITPHEQRPPGIGYERVPLEWRGMVIWINRKPVTDRRSA